MLVNLETPAIDGSTYIVRFSFTDETGAATVPTELEWRMENRGGQVVNNRDWAPIAPAESVDIVLQGADLYYDDGSARAVTIRGKYNSSLGVELSVTAESRFTITNLQGIRGS